MRKWGPFIFSLLVCVLFVYLLDNSYILKNKPIPAFGKLLNPVSGFWVNAEPLSIKPYGDVFAKSIQDEVRVCYDDRLVPHIFANNTHDAYFTQGYITAQHRLWQMDISTRAASGRLSEILGERLLNFDKNKRRMGMVFAAENTLKTWEKDPEMFALLQSYIDGVNAYIGQLKPKDYPVEFKILNYAPEKWTALKSALFVKAMSETLASGEDDLEATNALKLLGKETFDFLFPAFDEDYSPVIPKEVEWKFSAPVLNAVSGSDTVPNVGYIEYNPIQKREEGIGSNNWVVGPSKTKNGHPILCGDPHLNLTLPSIWYELQIHTPEFNTYGVSLPGLAGVIIGFNENIAWTQTNVGQDVSDWYTLKWKDATKKEYLLDGVYKSATRKIESFNVKGKGTVLDTVSYTYWGPVVYRDTAQWHDMALHWLAHEVPKVNDVKVFYLLNKAKNFEEYSEALRNYSCPAQNFAFACKNGDIALRVNGMFPLKGKTQGRFVQDGTKSENGWKGFIPFEQNPFVLNPSRAYVSSANQVSTTPDYPYYYNSETFDTYRGKKLNQLLDSMNSIEVADMQKLQSYSKSLKAEISLPLLLNVLDTSGLSSTQMALVRQLREWDYNYLKELFAPVLFEKWWTNFYELTWDEFYQNGKTPVMLRPTSWRTIKLLKDNPDNVYFDQKSTAQVENAGLIATKTFKMMADSVNVLIASNSNYKWKNMLDAKINHTGQIKPFSRSNFETNGVNSAINSQKSGNGPSWRMVVEMGDQVKAWVVYPGGQSGNPGSMYYDNFIQKWSNGEQYEALFMKKATEKNRILFSQTFKKS